VSQFEIFLLICWGLDRARKHKQKINRDERGLTLFGLVTIFKG